MESRRRIILVTAAVLAALSLASIVGASLYTLHWFWAALAIAGLALCLTIIMRRKFALPARGIILAAVVSAFVTSTLLYTSPVEVESHTMDCSSGHCRVVGTIKVNADCVSWARVSVTFYGPSYKINGSTHVRREAGYQYFTHMFDGDTRDFSVEFSGGFELERYRVTAGSGDEKWCERLRETPDPAEEYHPIASPASLEEIKAEGFVDPVTLIVQDMKAQGMSDDEIVAALEEMGMGWYPETGATWIGRKPTPEELQSLPPREYPFKEED